MPAETNLKILLEDLRPELSDETYVFCTVPGAVYGELSHTEPVASFVEPEGLTLVLTQKSAEAHKLLYQATFRCISLQVHSSLEAVGLTAAITSELATHGISANVIAGYYHDHIFVPSTRAHDALSALKSMSRRP